MGRAGRAATQTRKFQICDLKWSNFFFLISKRGEAGGRFGDYLCVDCANLPYVGAGPLAVLFMSYLPCKDLEMTKCPISVLLLFQRPIAH